MAILLAITDRDITPLKKKLIEMLSENVPVWDYQAIPDPVRVKMVVSWKHPAGLLATLPNLQLISSLGAGVEHILADPALPAGIPIVRIVEAQLVRSMRDYVLMCILHIQRQMRFVWQNQQLARWKKPVPATRELSIGLLGLGALGAPIASTLSELGFTVWGYSRHPKEITGVHCRSEEGTTLPAFVAQVNVLICLLPLTADTRDILNYELFQHLPKGSFLINVGRGDHLVEADLLRALQEGLLREAYLDVFRQEPLPPSHPFWTHPGVILTPHIASITEQENAAAVIAENYRRLEAGADLMYEIARREGY